MRSLAAERDKRADAALARFDTDEAGRLVLEATKWLAAASERERLEHESMLTERSRTFKVDEMTPTRLSQRGRRIAAGHAGDNVLLLAISKSRWGSMTNYARKRLKIAPSTLSQYMSGKVEAPADVAEKVAGDFPDVPWVWPAKQ